MTRQPQNLPQGDVEALNHQQRISLREGEVDERPCKFETFSGDCMVCGAGIDDECEWERERQ
jgi:hypothetical protein